MNGGIIIIDRSNDSPLPVPDPPTGQERREPEVHRLELSIHGSEAGVHEHWVERMVAYRA